MSLPYRVPFYDGMQGSLWELCPWRPKAATPMVKLVEISRLDVLAMAMWDMKRQEAIDQRKLTPEQIKQLRHRGYRPQ